MHEGVVDVEDWQVLTSVFQAGDALTQKLKSNYFIARPKVDQRSWPT